LKKQLHNIIIYWTIFFSILRLNKSRRMYKAEYNIILSPTTFNLLQSSYFLFFNKREKNLNNMITHCTVISTVFSNVSKESNKCCIFYKFNYNYWHSIVCIENISTINKTQQTLWKPASWASYYTHWIPNAVVQ